MLSLVKQQVPSTWTSSDQPQEVINFTEEYRKVSNEIKSAVSGAEDPVIACLTRVQDVHAFGQFLIREQLLLHDSSADLYRVRRYVVLPKTYKNDVIKHNLDPRRCGLGTSLMFQKRASFISRNDMVSVVNVLTRDPDDTIVRPTRSCDYYVEYIAEF